MLMAKSWRQSSCVSGTEWFKSKEKRRRKKKKAQWTRLSPLGCNAACGCSMCLSLLGEITECLLLMREHAAGKTSGILLLPFIGILSELCNGKSVSWRGWGGNWSPEGLIHQPQLSQNAAPGSEGLEMLSPWDTGRRANPNKPESHYFSKVNSRKEALSSVNRIAQLAYLKVY